MKTLKTFLTMMILLIVIVVKAQNPCFDCDGNNNVTGAYSGAFGQSNTVNGSYSFLAGANSTIFMDNSIILGFNSTTSVPFGFILGNNSRTVGYNSFTIGNYLRTNADNAMVIGMGYNNDNLLSNITPNSLIIGFGSVKPSIFVGTARQNGDIGFVGIGTTEPDYPFHVATGARFDQPIHTNSIHATTLQISNSLLTSGSTFTLRANNQTRLFVQSNGNLGIGTTSPQQRLHVNGHARIHGNVELSNADRFIGTITDNHLYLGTHNQNRITILNNGNVGIGTSNTQGYKLAVAGNIIAEEVVVKLQGNWPDYVFQDDYSLMSISEVKEHINQYGHLPGVPSAGHIEENGISLSQMNALMMEKIEELTLYIINQQKQIDELKELLIAKEE